MRRRHWGLNLTMLVIFGVAVATALNRDLEAFLNFWVTVLLVGGVVVAAIWHGVRVLRENWRIEEMIQREVAASGVIRRLDVDRVESQTLPLTLTLASEGDL